MLNIHLGPNDEVVMAGRFDAAQVGKANEFLDKLTGDRVVDCSALEYISSAGLGVLLATQKRLRTSGHGLKLINVNGHIKDVLHFSGFDQIFEIE